MNTITISTFRRPFHTRLCLESLCRAQRWSHNWADKIAVCIPCNGHEHPDVRKEVMGAIERNPDIAIEVWEEDCDSNPHVASKWMLDKAFAGGADICLYVEDDVIVSPDAFLLCELIRRGKDILPDVQSLAGVCLYHETIPEHYLVTPPNPTRLHFYNGLNTCGGTAFLRQPYLEILSPNWNCKQVLPTGFDYSAHYLMYIHKLYMVYPDLSRSMNIGFTGGALSQEQWARYCGRSIWTQTDQALKDWRDFRLDGGYPAPVQESWMIPELQHRGLL